MKIVSTIEARMTSKRLPGKVLKPILGKPALERLLERLQRSQKIQDIVVATTVNDTDQPVVDLCNQLGVKFYRGSEHDVLSRVYEAAKSVKADVLVEITGDSPLLDPVLVDQCVDFFFSEKCDYVSNCLVRTFPRGIPVQVFPFKVLEEIHQWATDPKDREHVTRYIYTHPEKYQIRIFKASPELARPDFAFTLDTPEDYQLITQIYERLYPTNPKFSLKEIIQLLDQHPELVEINRYVQRTVVLSEEQKSKF